MSRGKRRVTARLPVNLVERIDTRVEAWRAALPGMRVTRTDVIAILLEVGLRHPTRRRPTSPPWSARAKRTAHGLRDEAPERQVSSSMV